MTTRLRAQRLLIGGEHAAGETVGVPCVLDPSDCCGTVAYTGLHRGQINIQTTLRRLPAAGAVGPIACANNPTSCSGTVPTVNWGALSRASTLTRLANGNKIAGTGASDDPDDCTCPNCTYDRCSTAFPILVSGVIGGITSHISEPGKWEFFNRTWYWSALANDALLQFDELPSTTSEGQYSWICGGYPVSNFYEGDPAWWFGEQPQPIFLEELVDIERPFYKTHCWGRTVSLSAEYYIVLRRRVNCYGAGYNNTSLYIVRQRLDGGSREMIKYSGSSTLCNSSVILSYETAYNGTTVVAPIDIQINGYPATITLGVEKSITCNQFTTTSTLAANRRVFFIPEWPTPSLSTNECVTGTPNDLASLAAVVLYNTGTDLWEGFHANTPMMSCGSLGTYCDHDYPSFRSFRLEHLGSDSWRMKVYQDIGIYLTGLQTTLIATYTGTIVSGDVNTLKTLTLSADSGLCAPESAPSTIWFY